MNKSCEQAFGRLVRDKREDLRLSQMELSRRVKWPQAKVSRVEQGKRSVTLAELLELSRAFNCSASELFAQWKPAGLKTGGTLSRSPL